MQRKMQTERELSMKKDYIVRATAADGQVRAFAATSRNLVEEARKHHNTSGSHSGFGAAFDGRRHDGKHDEKRQ